jgi:multisubunit Na+/H+ antiporter MnhB subunit
VTRPFKAGALAVGIVGLLVLVAMAARGGHPGTTGHIATRAVPNSVQDSFITLLAIVYVVVIVAIVTGVVRYKSRWKDPGSNWLLNFALVVLLMLVATGIGYYAITHSHLGDRNAKATSGQRAGAGNQRNRPRAQPLPAREAHFQWPLALGVAGLALLGGVWVYIRRRGELAPGDGRTLEADIVAALETTIDDLRNERDARKAVIAAYAQMERTLTSHGLARHRAEAPFEYLARILRGLHVRDSAARTLTDLFEYAKFSGHEVDAAMKEEAIEALIAIREDLQREEQLAA